MLEVCFSTIKHQEISSSWAHLFSRDLCHATFHSSSRIVRRTDRSSLNRKMEFLLVLTGHPGRYETTWLGTETIWLEMRRESSDNTLTTNSIALFIAKTVVFVTFHVGAKLTRLPEGFSWPRQVLSFTKRSLSYSKVHRRIQHYCKTKLKFLIKNAFKLRKYIRSPSE